MKDPQKHPVRGFMQTAKALWNDLQCAPWDWLSPTPGGVELPAQPLFLSKPLRHTVARLQGWNRMAPSLHRQLKRPAREFVILSGETGGRFLRRHHPDVRTGVWLSDRTLATPGFVRKVGAAAIAKGARAAAVREDLFLGASMTPLAHGSPSLMPGERLVSDLLTRIFLGPTVAALVAELRMTSGCLHAEFSDLSIDGTVQVTQATIGQRPQGKAGEISDSQENTCITVRGRTGALLAVEPHHSESFDSLLSSLLAAVPESWRHQVQHICSDSPIGVAKWARTASDTFPECRSDIRGPHTWQIARRTERQAKHMRSFDLACEHCVLRGQQAWEVLRCKLWGRGGTRCFP